MAKKKELIVNAAFVFGGMIGSHIFLKKKYSKKLTDEKKNSNKNLSLALLLQRWLKQRINGRRVSDYFKEKGIDSIAIYGMNYMGDVLLDDLSNSGIEVKYGIDKNADRIFSHIPVYRPDEILPPVDVIIVTAISYFDSIEEMLNKKTDSMVLSLEDVVYEL